MSLDEEKALCFRALREDWLTIPRKRKPFFRWAFRVGMILGPATFLLVLTLLTFIAFFKY